MPYACGEHQIQDLTILHTLHYTFCFEPISASVSFFPVPNSKWWKPLHLADIGPFVKMFKNVRCDSKGPGFSNLTFLILLPQNIWRNKFDAGTFVLQWGFFKFCSIAMKRFRDIFCTDTGVRCQCKMRFNLELASFLHQTT